MHWNKSTGPEAIIQYPPEHNFPSKDLFLKIWAKHELNKAESMINYTPEEKNEHSYISVIHKFEGEIYFLMVEYTDQDHVKDVIQDNPDIIGIISKNLVELINSNKITRAISEAYTTLKNYTKLDKEENLLSFFRDKIKHTILKILQKGVLSKIQLKSLLRKQYGFSTSNIDLILSTFIREGLVKKKNIPGCDNCYFLIKDLSCIRIPPHELTISDKDGGLYDTYINEFQEFYATFDCTSEIENKRILHFLMDKPIFSLIKKLRNEVLTVNECLNILNNRQDVLDDLLKGNYIFEGQGKVILFSDIRFIKFTPAYIIQNITQRYKDEQISFNQFSEHLKLINEFMEKQRDGLPVNYEII
ncbi:MAG: hypothetical protein R6U96_03540 [Promethearchaeia archaeon]